MKVIKSSVIAGLVFLGSTAFAGKVQSYGPRTLIKNVVVESLSGKFKGDIVAGDVQESGSQIFFADLRLVSKSGVEFLLVNENYMVADSSIQAVEEVICAAAAPASYRSYKQSSPGNSSDVEGNAVLFLKDGSVIQSENSVIPAYSARTGVTCSQTVLEHVGE